MVVVLTVTSNWVSRLFLYGLAKGEIEKMRSIFFQRTKSSGVPVTQPAGCGGKSDKFKTLIRYSCKLKIINN